MHLGAQGVLQHLQGSGGGAGDRFARGSRGGGGWRGIVPRVATRLAADTHNGLHSEHWVPPKSQDKQAGSDYGESAPPNEKSVLSGCDVVRQRHPVDRSVRRWSSALLTRATGGHPPPPWQPRRSMKFAIYRQQCHSCDLDLIALNSLKPHHSRMPSGRRASFCHDGVVVRSSCPSPA